MPLSSVVGAQSIIKPGVCTSSTRPASPYDGQVIYETDTDRTLVWNGTGWVFLATSRANAGGLDLVKTQTIGSAVSSVTVTDAFSSTYENYLISISGGVASASNSLLMTLGATATGYYQNVVYMNYNSNSVNGQGQTNGSSWFGIYGTANNLNGKIELFGPNLAKNTTMNSVGARAVAAGESSSGQGYLADTTQYTAFTLTANTGTVTGGTIRVYGYANS